MKPLQYYIDNDQIAKLTAHLGDRLQNISNKDLWALVTIFAYELAHCNPGETAGIVRLAETRDLLCLGHGDGLEIALFVLDGIGRADCKALLMGLTAIACFENDL